MDRRRFLATAAAASALPLAGCSGVGIGATDLDAPETKTEPREKHLTFSRNDRRLLTFSVRSLRGYVEATGRIPLELDVWHADDTHLDSFRVAVRAPASGREPHARVFLRTPWHGSGPKLDFHRQDRATIVEASDLGIYGDGTLTLEFLLEPTSVPGTLPVRATGEFDFSGTSALGRSYRAEGVTTVEIPRDTDER